MKIETFFFIKKNKVKKCFFPHIYILKKVIIIKLKKSIFNKNKDKVFFLMFSLYNFILFFLKIINL